MIESTEQELERSARDCGIPEYIIEGLMDYIVGGVPPGDFLRAVLENRLFESFGRADRENREHLYHICVFLCSYAPQMCWGSPSKVEAWLEKFRKEQEQNVQS